MSRFSRKICQFGQCYRQFIMNSPRLRHFFINTQQMLFTNFIILRNTEKMVMRKLVEKYHNSKPLLLTQRFLLGACIFTWSDERITDDEIVQTLDELCPHPKKQSPELSELDDLESEEDSNDTDESSTPKLTQTLNLSFIDEEWELILDKTNTKMWRRPVGEGTLYEYKMCGILDDVSPRAFLEVQTNLPYRSSWDNWVIKLSVIDVDRSTNSEVVHWVTKYTYPLCHREYIYVRRIYKDASTGRAVMVSRALPSHPQASPPDGVTESQMVRVVDYRSTLLIVPHSDDRTNGLTYYLTYYDDPQTSFPKFAYNYVATCGIPEFVEKLRKAAKDLQDNGGLEEPAMSDSANYLIAPK